MKADSLASLRLSQSQESARTMVASAAEQSRTSTSDVCTYAIHFAPRPFADQASSISFSEAALQATATSILTYVDQLSRDYIWQREPFNLSITAASFKSLSPHLTGATRMGESVEDEWYIVWLLKEISLKWPDAAIEMRDDDSQFLLIEAAEALPTWVTPANADNRASSLRVLYKHMLINSVYATRYGSILDNSTLFHWPSHHPYQPTYLNPQVTM